MWKRCKHIYIIAFIELIVITFFSYKGFAKFDDVYISPYQGEYIIELHKINNPNLGIIDAKGTLSYKLKKDCLGWIAETSIIMDIILETGEVKSIISNLSSYESFDGWNYSFAVDNYDMNETSAFIGNVDFLIKDDKAIVKYNSPKKQKSMILPMNTLFPVALYKNIIKASDENIAHFTAPYFDGSSPVELYTASVFITSKSQAVMDSIIGDTNLLQNQELIKSSIAFFINKEQTPKFESQFKILHNGILVQMIQTMGPIEVKISLQELHFISIPACLKR